MDGDEETADASELLPPHCDSGAAGLPQQVPSAVGSESSHPAKPMGWRFSVRALILLQFLLAIAFALVIARVNSFRQQEAVATKFVGRHLCSFRRTSAKPEWFWKSVGNLTHTRPEDIYEVHIGDLPLRRAEAVEISRLRSLKTIWLAYGVAEQDALEPLSSLPELNRLDLRDADGHHLSNDSLTPLLDCHSLTYVTIQSKNVDDIGVGRLAKSRSIRTLDIQYAKVSIAGLRPWIAEERLEELSVPSDLSNEEIKDLSQLSSLRTIRLPSLSTGAAEHLATMPNLIRVEPFRSVPSDSALRVLPKRIGVHVSRDLVFRNGEVVEE